MKKAFSALTLMACFATQLCAQNLYRYVDENGVTILNSSIPADYVKGGYEVLSPAGLLLETVEPIEDENSRTFALDSSDLILMRSYSDVTEIQEHRDRKLDGIQRDVSNIETDKRVLMLQMEESIAEQNRILAIQEQRELSEYFINTLAQVTSEIGQMKLTAERLDAQLIQREEDTELVRQEYAVKIERFLQLKAAGAELPSEQDASNEDG